MRARKRPHARGGVQKFLRARGPNLKILAGAGGRWGQISKFSRVRAGSGARSARPGARGPLRASFFQH